MLLLLLKMGERSMLSLEPLICCCGLYNNCALIWCSGINVFNHNPWLYLLIGYVIFVKRIRKSFIVIYESLSIETLACWVIQAPHSFWDILSNICCAVFFEAFYRTSSLHCQNSSIFNRIPLTRNSFLNTSLSKISNLWL